MTNRYRNITELVGKTPLMELRRYQQAHKLSAVLLAKLEYLNPTGSVKDRAALGMIEDAERRGLLAAGGVIIEPTSGNTGIGLAMLAAARGYQAIFTMPETMSIERRRLLAAYGAKVVLTEGAKGMAGAIAKAKELAAELPGAFLAGQFENPANPAAHYAATGPEIWRDTQGEVEAFVAGVGTGGTISGVGRYLKEQKPAVRVVAVEPEASPVLSGGKPGPHRLQGIGAGFVPQNFDAAACDEILPVAEQDAFAACRELARLEGLLVGATSGAAVHAAAQLARRQEFRGKVIVALLPDTGARYLSTDLFGQEEG